MSQCIKVQSSIAAKKLFPGKRHWLIVDKHYTCIGFCNMKRCKWTGNDPLLIEYHDKEWGVPLFDDDRQFEFLSLEVMQCGLSWMTVLRKREVMRKAFDAFSPKLVSQYTDEDVFRIMNTEGMIRSERKIRAVISNARHFIEIQEEHGSFSNFIKFSIRKLTAWCCERNDERRGLR